LSILKPSADAALFLEKSGAHADVVAVPLDQPQRPQLSEHVIEMSGI
jgi:hypothetical protein